MPKFDLFANCLQRFPMLPPMTKHGVINTYLCDTATLHERRDDNSIAIEYSEEYRVAREQMLNNIRNNTPGKVLAANAMRMLKRSSQLPHQRVENTLHIESYNAMNILRNLFEAAVNADFDADITPAERNRGISVIREMIFNVISDNYEALGRNKKELLSCAIDQYRIGLSGGDYISVTNGELNRLVQEEYSSFMFAQQL